MQVIEACDLAQLIMLEKAHSVESGQGLSEVQELF